MAKNFSRLPFPPLPLPPSLSTKTKPFFIKSALAKFLYLAKLKDTFGESRLESNSTKESCNYFSKRAIFFSTPKLRLPSNRGDHISFVLPDFFADFPDIAFYCLISLAICSVYMKSELQNNSKADDSCGILHLQILSLRFFFFLKKNLDYRVIFGMSVEFCWKWNRVTKKLRRIIIILQIHALEYVCEEKKALLSEWNWNIQEKIIIVC